MAQQVLAGWSVFDAQRCSVFSERQHPLWCHAHQALDMTPKYVHFWKPKYVQLRAVMYVLCLPPASKVCAWVSKTIG